jgi:hypothetical protein
MYACQLNSITNRFAFFCLKKELSSRTKLHFLIGLDLIQVNFVRFQISYLIAFPYISSNFASTSLGDINTKPFGCYMVKPHGQLVQVSLTPYNASTPCLSTS